MFPNVAAATTAHSHSRDRNSLHPSRSSCANPVLARTRPPTRMNTRIAPLAKYVAASNASAQPDPTAATRMPPAAAPMTNEPFVVMRRSTFACWSLSSVTVCGTSPVDAGKKNDCAMPRTSWVRTRCHSVAVPVSSTTAATSCAPPLSTFDADQDEMARQPVGDDATDEEEHDLRQPGRGEHEPELSRAAVEVVDDGKREGDGCDGRPEERDEPAREEQAELPLGERREGAEQRSASRG